MKKKIYILPSTPSESEIRSTLECFTPPIHPRIKEQLIVTYNQIQSRLRDAAINQPSFHAHHSQSISDGTHTVTLVGRLDPPSGLQKFLDMFG